MALTVTVDVPPRDREILESWQRSPSVRAGLAQRARIVLLAADGMPVTDIVERVGVSKPTVIGWKKRYAAEGLGGLEDRRKSGRPKQIDDIEVVLATLEPPPERLGVTHWSSRLLAGQLGISHVWVGKIWKDWGLQPWKSQTFKFSTDPELEAKVRDVVGLYLHPPENAIVLCCDEKSQIQALDRTAPILPLRPGIPENPRHRHQEFLRFLKQVATAYPRRKLHVVCDNYQTHKHDKVRAWLARNPRITLHFTPTSGSWLNMVEIFFGIITRQAIRRGSFTSVTDLVAAIRRFIDGWNDRCHPFTWTKTADDILDHATPGQRTSFTRH